MNVFKIETESEVVVRSVYYIEGNSAKEAEKMVINYEKRRNSKNEDDLTNFPDEILDGPVDNRIRTQKTKLILTIVEARPEDR